MKLSIVLLLCAPMVASAAYTLTNGNFASGTTGWTTGGTVNASSGAAVLSASSSVSQDFSSATVGTAENYDFQLDFSFQVSALNQNQRIRIRDNANSGDLITLRFNSGSGIQAFSSAVWNNALTFSHAINTTYWLRVTGVDLDLSSRSFTVAMSTDGVNYTSSSSLSLFHFAGVGTDFETLTFESGASTSMTLDNVTVIPESSTALLGGLGLFALLRRRRA